MNLLHVNDVETVLPFIREDISTDEKVLELITPTSDDIESYKNLDQKSPAWFQARRPHGISTYTGSTAGSYSGMVGKQETNLKYFTYVNECGIPLKLFAGCQATRYGVNNEPNLIELFRDWWIHKGKAMMEIKYEGQVMDDITSINSNIGPLLHPEFPFMRFSPDLIMELHLRLKNNTILKLSIVGEGKCPFSQIDIDPLRDTPLSPFVDVPYYTDKLPIVRQYVAQMCHGMMVTGAQLSFFIQFTRFNFGRRQNIKEIVYKFICWNEMEFILNKMMEAEIHFFWKLVITRLRQLQKMYTDVETNSQKVSGAIYKTMCS